MGSELCKTCIHTKVCMHDKNLVGDLPVMGHPMFFDNDKLYKEYKERERQGFPCEDYMPTVEAKWIPVTGRLPKNFNYVLVTRENPYGEKEVTRARFTGARWIGCGKVTNVFAWMPLPEPYNKADMRGGENEHT